jgi:hypothetical protein
MELDRDSAVWVSPGVVLDHLQGVEVCLGPVTSRKDIRRLTEVKEVPGIVPNWRRKGRG